MVHQRRSVEWFQHCPSRVQPGGDQYIAKNMGICPCFMHVALLQKTDLPEKIPAGLSSLQLLFLILSCQRLFLLEGSKSSINKGTGGGPSGCPCHLRTSPWASSHPNLRVMKHLHPCSTATGATQTTAELEEAEKHGEPVAIKGCQTLFKVLVQSSAKNVECR